MKLGLLTIAKKAMLSISVCLGLNLMVHAQVPTIYWDKSFGGLDADELKCIQQTADGGYILGGFTTSGVSGNKSSINKGLEDYWVVKVDVAGNKEWDKSFGGTGSDKLNALQQTADGGYILGGQSNSPISVDKSQSFKGAHDYWIIKLDATGNKIWDKTYGGANFDILYSLKQTPDGGYILGGLSGSKISSDKSENSTSTDFWVLKVDSTGNRIWDNTLGGSGIDEIYSLDLTTDGGYILGGVSLSGISADKSQGNRGDEDYWVVKINAAGTKVWDKTFGGSGSDTFASLEQTSDGGYILGGYSYSGVSGEKSQPVVGTTTGTNDYWIIKIDANGLKQWDKTYGGTWKEEFYCVKQTPDGGYILGGTSRSNISGDKTEANKGFGFSDYWILKLNASGNKTWDKTIGATHSDDFRSLDLTTDGGYILAGSSDSAPGGHKTASGHGYTDYWIVKFGGQPLGLPYENLPEMKLTMYPNPVQADKSVTIQLPEALTGEGMAYLYDLTGKLIKQQLLYANQQNQLLSLKSLKSGIYQVKVIAKNQSRTIKLVVQ